MEFHEKALNLVAETTNEENPQLKLVWFTKTLQNWKAMVANINADGYFYEVTYNGDKKETYIDTYKKFDNVCIEDVDLDVIQ